MPQADEQTDTSEEVVDTSTNEETQDTDDLEDIEVSEDDIKDDETEESEAKDEESEDEEADTEPPAEEEPKEDVISNQDAAARRIQEKANKEAVLKRDQQDYLSQADPEKPEAMAIRQLEINAYNNTVNGNTDRLTNNYEKAMNDFPILRDESPQIKAEVDAALDAFQAIHVTIDSYGNPTDVRGDLYKYLQSKADSIKNLTGMGARNQIKSKDKEKSKTFTPPSKTPKEPKKDLDLEAFDEEAAK